MFFAGFDKQCITPGLPVSLSGYAGKRVATGVHDELYTRCIALKQESESFLIVQCDCIAIEDSLRSAVLAKIPDLQIPREHLIIAATHTHSGPSGTIDTNQPPFLGLTDVFGEPDTNFQNELADKIALAAKNAFSDMKECRLTIGKGVVENVGTERHDPALAGDNTLLVLLFEQKCGKRALLYNYACHPTVLNPANLLITADFPYAVEQLLDYDLTMFINSNAGDISTRFTRTESSYRQAEVFGEIIVKSIENALQHPIYTGDLNLVKMNDYPITFPVKKMDSLETLTAQLAEYKARLKEGQFQGLPSGELRILASYAEGAEVSLGLFHALQGLEKIEAVYSVITLENLTIATIPGELFSTLGMKLKNNGIEVFGYTNGYYMYLADREAYDKGYYEAMSSPFPRGCGELLVNEILKNKSSDS